MCLLWKSKERLEREDTHCCHRCAGCETLLLWSYAPPLHSLQYTPTLQVLHSTLIIQFISLLRLFHADQAISGFNANKMFFFYKNELTFHLFISWNHISLTKYSSKICQSPAPSYLNNVIIFYLNWQWTSYESKHILAFLCPCDFQWRSMSLKLFPKCGVQKRLSPHHV